MAELTHSEKLALQDAACMFLLRGTDERGQPQYAYILVKGDKLAAFKNALSQKNVDVGEYGPIIAHGPGDPPKDVMKKMAGEYGFDHKNMVWL